MTARICMLVALGTLLAAPRVALAQKFSKQTIDMQGVQGPVRQAPAPRQETQATPGLTIEKYLGQVQASIQNIIDRQIVYMRSLIKLASPDDPQLPDYYFRLGELFVEKYRYADHLARSLDEPIFRAEHATEQGSAVQPQRQQEYGPQ